MDAMTLFARLQEGLARAGDTGTVRMEGYDLTIERAEDGDGSTVVQATSPGVPGGARITQHAPAAERPAGYPAEIPFLPGLPVAVSESPRWAGWFATPDVEAALRALVEASALAGWTPGPAVPLPGTPVGTSVVGLRRGAELRVLTAAAVGRGGVVTLADTAGSPPG